MHVQTLHCLISDCNLGPCSLESTDIFLVSQFLQKSSVVRVSRTGFFDQKLRVLRVEQFL